LGWGPKSNYRPGGGGVGLMKILEKRSNTIIDDVEI